MRTSKKTLVLGASLNPARYSNLVIQRLTQNGHPVVAIGRVKGTIGDVAVQDNWNQITEVDTLSIYLRSERQEDCYHEILELGPKRIILNPGAENPELAQLARNQGIEVLEACNLVMLSAGTF